MVHASVCELLVFFMLLYVFRIRYPTATDEFADHGCVVAAHYGEDQLAQTYY